MHVVSDWDARDGFRPVISPIALICGCTLLRLGAVGSPASLCPSYVIAVSQARSCVCDLCRWCDVRALRHHIARDHIARECEQFPLRVKT